MPVRRKTRGSHRLIVFVMGKPHVLLGISSPALARHTRR